MPGAYLVTFDYKGKSHSFDRNRDADPEVGEILLCNIEGHRLRLRVADVVKPTTDAGTVSTKVVCVVLD